MKRKQTLTPEKREKTQDKQSPERFLKKDGISILRVLDKRDSQSHCYKEFQNHSKVSELPEIINIIQ